MSKKWKKAPAQPRKTTPVVSVPNFPRLDEYAGIWAMESRAAAALWEKVRGIDLPSHIANKPAELRSSVTKEPARGGKYVAIVKVMGTLMKQQASIDGSTSTVQLRRDIRQAAADPEVSAILLAIDSPGGTVAGTDDLAADIRAAAKKKPMYAQIEDLGASAAYWLASQAEQVFANSPTALVGSIGTLMTIYDVSGMADKNGIKAMVFATGPLKGAGVEGTQVSEEQAAYFQGLVNSAQTSFDAAVSKGRGLTDKQLADVRTGGVFSATEALEKKLIDGIQSLETTLAQLIQAGWKAAHPINRQTAKRTESRNMDFSAWLTQQGFDESTLTEQQLASLQLLHAEDEGPAFDADRAACAAEAQRLSDLRRLCASNPTMQHNGQTVSIEAHAIGQGWDAQRTEMAVQLAELRTSRAQGPAIISHDHSRDCTLEALQGAMILRANGQLDHPSYQSPQAISIGVPQWLRMGLNAEKRQRAMEMSHRYADLSMLDLCREAIRLDGKSIPTGRSETIQAAFSGGALTNIFTTNVNTIVLSTYMEAGDTTGGWTSTVDVADFKTNERPRMAKGPNLAKLPRGGEADHYSRSDLVESYKIARYAKQFQVDEQDIIDDSFSALADMPREMGMAGARLRPDLVYALMLRNAALGADSVALFHATHSNLNTTATLASGTLKTAIAALEKQRESSINLNLRATHLIVPSDLKHTGAELINSSQMIAGGDTAVGLRGSMNTIAAIENLTLVAEARLSNGVNDPVDDAAQTGSTTTWYLASSMGHNVEVAYLRGTGRAPQVRSFVLDKGKWGIGWDCKLDIGAKALDFRGMSKNTA